METKRTIYLIMIVGGSLIIWLGQSYFPKEIVLGIGFVSMMYGLYKTTQLWIDDERRAKEERKKEKERKENEGE